MLTPRRHLLSQIPPDIKGTVELVRHSNVLRIEDILPLFPDFVVIDEFKDEICSALEDYSRHIEDLRRAMQESTMSADSIRKDIRDLRAKATFLSSNQRCDSCSQTLLTQALYSFPCGHAFHSTCLKERVLPSLAVSATAADDETLSSACPLCGPLMIDSVDTPFILPSEASEIVAWRL